MRRWSGLLLLLFLVRCDCDGDSIKPCEGLDRADQLGAPCSEDIAGCMRVGTLRCEVNANGPNAVVCDLAPPPAEMCNGVDDDCDTRVDEAQGGAACMAGEGICAAAGEEVCQGGQLVCDAAVGMAEVERCNTEDDDCDGRVDEIPPTPCSAGIGACARNGEERCENGATLCNAEPAPAGIEQCGGGDEDCDGQTDEVLAGQIDGCALPNVNAHGCANGTCTIDACAEGFRDEDGDAANGCECSDAIDLPDADGIDSNCDGVDGMANASIFVDPVNGNDAAAGTMAQPVQTLNQALQLAAGGQAILLAVGEYDVGGGLLTLPGGTRIHGGYQPAGDGWRRPFGDSRITGHHQVLRVIAEGTPTLLDGVDVEADDAPHGQSSIAVLVRGDGLRITGATFTAGDGGAGTAGAEGDGFSATPRGLRGQDYDSFCPGCPGRRGETECEDANGGRGGTGAQDGLELGSRGENGRGGRARQGRGGNAGPAGMHGENGVDGVDGDNGSSSAPDPGTGRLDPLSDAWQPGGTLSGGPATPGGGGGGGGGGGRRADNTGIGGGGAGGGAGGCLGQPGSGATGGGASIALQMVGGTVTLVDSVLVAGRGGDGGAGGVGAIGRRGGDGGPGGAGCPGCGDGGDGGRGGNGGCGGMAGGGASGHALPILRVDLPGAAAGAVLQATETRVGQAGTPGQGGSRENCANVAEDGALGLTVPQACCAAADLACQTLEPCP